MAVADKQQYTFEEFAAEMMLADEAVATLPIAQDRQEAIRDIVYADVAGNFDAAATAWGEPWAPHSPFTIQKYGQHPLLILTGKMKDAATTQGAQGNFESVSEREIVFGVDMSFASGFDYATAQQFGTEKIPARPFFDLSSEAIARIAAVARDYFVHEVIG